MSNRKSDHSIKLVHYYFLSSAKSKSLGFFDFVFVFFGFTTGTSSLPAFWTIPLRFFKSCLNDLLILVSSSYSSPSSSSLWFGESSLFNSPAESSFSFELSFLLLLSFCPLWSDLPLLSFAFIFLAYLVLL
jgi:hypothetical protein